MTGQEKVDLLIQVTT